MKELAPNTPVIVGVGFVQEKTADPLECPEAVQLMLSAVRKAAVDATGDRAAGDRATGDSAAGGALLEQLDSISVQKGSWKYSNMIG